MNKLLIIGGPTGIGKSELGVKLALRYNGVVIGADSMQIYKGLNIGTGKIKEEEKCGILHSMIDILSPRDDYSVQKYVIDAKREIAKAHAAGKLPIVVGGTGLYINALINEQNFAATAPNIELRKKYSRLADEKGAEYLHEMLKNVDPQSAERISVNDTKRVIRALEIFESVGVSKSEAVSVQKSHYDVKFYVLETDRNILYDRINRRVDKMFAEGFADEVIGLKEYWNCRCMEAIGYRELIGALQYGLAPDSVIDTVKQNSRRYAKRQITFFKWICADKQFVGEDFYENVTDTADLWIKEG